MATTVKPVLRKDFKKKNGEHPIYLRLTINRQIKLYSLNVSCQEKDWDEKMFHIKSKNCETTDEKNLLIKSATNKAEEILFSYAVSRKSLTFYDFENEFKQKKVINFFDFVDNELEANKTTKHNSVSSSHTIKCDSSKLKKFSPNLSFNDITIPFLNAYAAHMRDKLGNKTNTIHKSMRFIRNFVNRAKAQGLTQNEVFENYKLKTESTYRDYCNEKELIDLENLLHSDISQAQKYVLKYFLFCCYTGLRYTDIKNLRYSDIKDNLIVIIMHKTKEQVRIPLIDSAKELIDLSNKSDSKVFKVATNQVVNRQLEKIIEKAGVKKQITFHCSRHTFAVIAIAKGIPIHIVSKILGHKDLKVTQIYAKIIDSVLFNEMDKLNNRSQVKKAS
ncbi:MAG: site-specific integrase [Bacteroidota bacterium]